MKSLDEWANQLFKKRYDDLTKEQQAIVYQRAMEEATKAEVEEW